MSIEPVGRHIQSSDLILGSNDDTIRKCDIIR